MPINFSIYPSSNRVPGVWAEIDPTQANTASTNNRTLIIGQVLAATPAAAAPNVPFLATSYTAARTACGGGSMLSLMYQQYRKTDSFGEVWLMPVLDNAAGVAGTATILLAGTSTAAGTLNLYIAGNNVQVGIPSGSTATAAATLVNAAINAAADLPVTSSVTTATVTVTSRHKGLAAGDIDIRLNYLGAASGESTPAGLTVTITPMTNGATDPTLDFSNLGDNLYDFICTPYTATTQVTAITSLLNDTTGRWSWQSELFGGAFSARRGTVGNLVTYGSTLNDQHISFLGINDTPAPMYLVAADYTAVCSASLRADPALPLQNIGMNIPAPPRASRFIITERNTLLYSGISTYKVSDAGQVILERAVTSYQKNAAGAADNSYLDVETLYTLQYLIRDCRQMLQTKFARKKLVADGTLVPAGSNFVTSQNVKNEVVAWYRKQAADGYCQNADTFTRTVVAQNVGNGRVSLMLPFDVANQLRIISLLVPFVKS